MDLINFDMDMYHPSFVLLAQLEVNVPGPSSPDLLTIALEDLYALPHGDHVAGLEGEEPCLPMVAIAGDQPAPSFFFLEHRHTAGSPTPSLAVARRVYAPRGFSWVYLQRCPYFISRRLGILNHHYYIQSNWLY